MNKFKAKYVLTVNNSSIKEVEVFKFLQEIYGLINTTNEDHLKIIVIKKDKLNIYIEIESNIEIEKLLPFPCLVVVENNVNYEDINNQDQVCFVAQKEFLKVNGNDNQKQFLPKLLLHKEFDFLLNISSFPSDIRIDFTLSRPKTKSLLKNTEEYSYWWNEENFNISSPFFFNININLYVSKENDKKLLVKLFHYEVGSALFNFYDGNGKEKANIFHISEIVPLIPLPISVNKIRGIENKIYPPFEYTPISDKQGLPLGTIIDYSSSKDSEIFINHNLLTKHGLIAGMTGSGKTTTIISLLQKMQDKRIKCMVIDPTTKKEFECLSNYEIYRLSESKNDSNFKLNIFRPIRGISIAKHIEMLMSCFAVGLPELWEPLPLILEKSIKFLYEDLGWDLSETFDGNNSKKLPSLSLLYRVIPYIIDTLGYSEGKSSFSKDAKAALLLRFERLKTISHLLDDMDFRPSISFEDLYNKNVVFELGELFSDDLKNFLSGLLFSYVYEYCMKRSKVDTLSHLTVIEEAHRILTSSYNISHSSSSLYSSGFQSLAEKTFSNALAELRGYGEGIVILEQIPSKLIPDVVKNTGFKVLHRMVDKSEREYIGKSMLLSEEQIDYIPLLSPGEAIIFNEELSSPILLRVVKPIRWEKEKNPSNNNYSDIQHKNEEIKPYPTPLCVLCNYATKGEIEKHNSLYNSLYEKLSKFVNKQQKGELTLSDIIKYINEHWEDEKTKQSAVFCACINIYNNHIYTSNDFTIKNIKNNIDKLLYREGNNAK